MDQFGAASQQECYHSLFPFCSTKTSKKRKFFPLHTLFISFLQLHIHKVSITLLIFLFWILFLCSLPNSAHFLSICMFRSKPTNIGRRKSKIANQFCVFRNWKEPSFFISISYNLTHFETIKFSKKRHLCSIFHWTNIDSWLRFYSTMNWATVYFIGKLI